MLKLFLTISFLIFLIGVADAAPPFFVEGVEGIKVQVSILLGALTAIAFSIGAGMKW